jgi:MFS family permease
MQERVERRATDAPKQQLDLTPRGRSHYERSVIDGAPQPQLDLNESRPPAGSGRSVAAAPAEGYARALVPQLGAPAWILLAGGLLNSAGSGAVYPFIVIYLHGVRGFSFPVAGAIVAVFGAFTLVATPIAGEVVDRIDSRRTLVAALALLAAGYGAFAFVSSPWQGFACMAAAGLGNAAFYPAHTTLLVGLVPGAELTAVFGLGRVGHNLGMAAGGVAGGLIAVSSSPGTFTILFGLNAASFLAFAAVAAGLPRVAAAPPAADERRPGYREVLRDRPFVALIALNVVLVAGVMAQVETTLPAFAHRLGLDERAIGGLFAVNMLLIVVFQLPVLRLVEGRRRARVVALGAVAYAIGAAGALAVGLSWRSGAAGAGLVAVMVVYTVGELLHAPTQSALAADLAPAPLRGRYMSLVTCSYALGFTLGPALGGILLGRSPALLWGVAAILAVAAAAGFVALDQIVPAEARLVPARTPRPELLSRPRRRAASAVVRRVARPAAVQPEG